MTQTATIWLISSATVVLGVFLYIPGIAWLRRLNFGQHIREDGPQTHLSKKGTPTMGGLVFVPLGVAGVLAAAMVQEAPDFGFATYILSMMGLGFLDDYLSIKRGKSLGLKASQKLAAQVLLTAAFLVYIFIGMYEEGDPLIEMRPVLFLIGMTFWGVWTINAANIADGLDGLCGSQGIIAIIAIIIYSYSPGDALVFLPMVAALLAYLFYNRPKAKVFMGDTGSMALGAFVFAASLYSQTIYIFFLVTLVWSLEALSVLLQVGYYKLSGGKRIFKMAPIHHHFELIGWKETTVTTVFIAASAFFALLVPWLLQKAGI